MPKMHNDGSGVLLQGSQVVLYETPISLVMLKEFLLKSKRTKKNINLNLIRDCSTFKVRSYISFKNNHIWGYHLNITYFKVLVAHWFNKF